MRKYILIPFLILSLFAQAQQISFQRNYAKGENSSITTFTELRSMNIVLAYTKINMDVSHAGPHTLELHLMKTDQNGNEIWDKLIRKDTTRFPNDRFCTQHIDEQNDGSLVLDITYPYGEKYLAKFDASGNQKWESYSYNSFGDFNLHPQLIKQRGRHLAMADGSVMSFGGSFVNVYPKATMTIIDAAGTSPLDFTYYRGYFNDAYYLNNEHIYTIGVEQTDTNENLVLSDLRADGGTNYHLKTAHKRFEKILATRLFYSSTKIRIAESVSKSDTGFYVRIIDYDHTGKYLFTANYRLKCAATSINLSNFETEWVLSNSCKAEQSQTIEKMDANSHLTFSFSDSFDNVLMLKKVHDGNFLFCFSKGSGINLWKLNAKGTLQTGEAAEGSFAPNPAVNFVTFVGSKETFNHGVSVSLYDMLGNTLSVNSFAALEPVTLNVSGYREGIYNYRLTTDDGKTLKGKIVVYSKGR